MRRLCWRSGRRRSKMVGDTPSLSSGIETTRPSGQEVSRATRRVSRRVALPFSPPLLPCRRAGRIARRSTPRISYHLLALEVGALNSKEAGGPQRPGEKPFVPFERFEDLVVRCGHVEKFGLMPDGKDRFRDGRRRKLAGRDCAACREKKRLELEAADEARRAAKESRKQGEVAKPAKDSRPHAGRLPDGSRYEVRYDATRQEWSGTLTVPPLTFEGAGSGLFALLAQLDSQYRATLEPAEKDA